MLEPATSHEVNRQADDDHDDRNAEAAFCGDQGGYQPHQHDEGQQAILSRASFLPRVATQAET